MPIYSTHRRIGNACPGHSRFGTGNSGLPQLLSECVELYGEISGLLPDVIRKPGFDPESSHGDLQEVMDESVKSKRRPVAFAMHLRVNTWSSCKSKHVSARSIKYIFGNPLTRQRVNCPGSRFRILPWSTRYPIKTVGICFLVSLIRYTNSCVDLTDDNRTRRRQGNSIGQRHLVRVDLLVCCAANCAFSLDAYLQTHYTMLSISTNIISSMLRFVKLCPVRV